MQFQDDWKASQIRFVFDGQYPAQYLQHILDKHRFIKKDMEDQI